MTAKTSSRAAPGSAARPSAKRPSKQTAAAAAEATLLMDLYDQPGHLMRRAQQIAVSMFHETMDADVTPVQYAILRMLQENPGIDQLTLAGFIALDKSTTADIAARLEKRGLIHREVMARGQRKLSLTKEGIEALTSMVPSVHRLREKLLSSLDEDERAEFVRLLKKFVHLNNDQSRSPLKRG